MPDPLQETLAAFSRQLSIVQLVNAGVYSVNDVAMLERMPLDELFEELRRNGLTGERGDQPLPRPGVPPS